MTLEHWLPAAAAIFLTGMMLYGHYRGFLRQCVSLGALLLTIAIVKVATPGLTAAISENPVIRETISSYILDAAGWTAPQPETEGEPSAQRISIEEMQLPESIKKLLLENNNNEIYEMMGVGEFANYIGTYLANMVIRAIVSVVLFLTCSVAIHIMIRWLNLLTRLPIISGLNKIAGAVLGLAQGFLILWVGGFFVSLFAATPTGQMLEEQIYSSSWLTVIYQYNLIRILMLGVVQGIF